MATRLNINSMRIEARESRVEAIERLASIETAITNLSQLTIQTNLPYSSNHISQSLKFLTADI